MSAPWINPKTIIGNTAQGDFYYPRPIIEASIWEEIEKGNHVLIAAPRRVEDIAWFWEALLNHHQIQLVLSFFESEKHGPALRERYMLLYYAALLLAGRTDDNLLLRIPPEVMPTVEELVQQVQEKQALYAEGPRADFGQAPGIETTS